MFGIGIPQLIIIFVIVFFIFGIRRIPELGSALGKGIINFKRGLEGRDEDDAQGKRS